MRFDFDKGAMNMHQVLGKFRQIWCRLAIRFKKPSEVRRQWVDLKFSSGTNDSAKALFLLTLGAYNYFFDHGEHSGTMWTWHTFNGLFKGWRSNIRSIENYQKLPMFKVTRSSFSIFFFIFKTQLFDNFPNLIFF